MSQSNGVTAETESEQLEKQVEAGDQPQVVKVTTDAYLKVTMEKLAAAKKQIEELDSTNSMLQAMIIDLNSAVEQRDGVITEQQELIGHLQTNRTQRRSAPKRR